MVTFLSPWARWLVGAALVIGLALGAWLWHRSAVLSHDAAIIAARDSEWREKLAQAERDARDTIRRAEATAYEAGVKAAETRAAADARDEARAVDVVARIETEAPADAACVYSPAAAAALNSLRRDP